MVAVEQTWGWREAMLEISRLRLNAPDLAEKRIAAILERVSLESCSSTDLFLLLEYASPVLLYLRATAFRSILEHAPHLDEKHEARFQQGFAMWQKLVDAYFICFRMEQEKCECSSSEESKLLLATLLHRCLYYTGMQLLDHYLVKRQVRPGLWHQVNQFYAKAENLGLKRMEVRHEQIGKTARNSCQAIYAALLLTEFAQPYACSADEIELIWSLAEKSAHMVTFRKGRKGETGEYLAIDLNSDHAVRLLHKNKSSELRCLVTTALVFGLKKQRDEMLHAQESGEFPLDSESRKKLRLLKKMANRWTLAVVPRRFRRNLADGKVLVCTENKEIHALIFGEKGMGIAMDPKMEEWQVADQNPCGFRLARIKGQSQLKHRQLIAFRPHDGGEFLLGQVQWLMKELSGRVVVGLSVLPGIPKPDIMSYSDSCCSTAKKEIQVFFLPPINALNEPASVILPPGNFRPGVCLNSHSCGKSILLLQDLLQRGPDFERATYRFLVTAP